MLADLHQQKQFQINVLVKHLKTTLSPVREKMILNGHLFSFAFVSAVPGRWNQAVSPRKHVHTVGDELPSAGGSA